MKLTVILVALLLVTMLAIPAFAGYQVTPSVDELSYGYRYTWSIYNDNPVNITGEDWPGSLDGLCIAVPLATVVISVVPPPPYWSDGYWTFEESMGPIITTGWGAGQPVSAPPSGEKWLKFWGSDNNSLYRPGSTAVFEIVTNKDTVPGTTRGALVECYIPGYSTIYVDTTGPRLVPEPSGLLALAAGMISASIAMKSKRRRVGNAQRS